MWHIPYLAQTFCPIASFSAQPVDQTRFKGFHKNKRISYGEKPWSWQHWSKLTKNQTANNTHPQNITKTRKHLKSCHLINRRSWVGNEKKLLKNTPISLATRAFTNCRVFLPPGELWGFLSANETIARWRWKGKGKEVRPMQRDRIGTLFCSERKDLLINGTILFLHINESEWNP